MKCKCCGGWMNTSYPAKKRPNQIIYYCKCGHRAVVGRKPTDYYDSYRDAD